MHCKISLKRITECKEMILSLRKDAKWEWFKRILCQAKRFASELRLKNNYNSREDNQNP